MKKVCRRVNNFFLWLSITDPDIIEMEELRREKIIQSAKGQVILLVSLFATLSGIYATYITSQSFLFSILIGLLWGYFILTVDRLLTAPFKIIRYAEPVERLRHNYIKPILIRLPLALLLGILISIPILLKIFRPEIKKHWIEARIPDKEGEDKRTKEDWLKKKEMIQTNYDLISTEFAKLTQLFNNSPILTYRDSVVVKAYIDKSFLKTRTQQLEVLSEQKDNLFKRLTRCIDSVNAFVPKSNYEIRGQLSNKFDSEVSLGERFEVLQTVLAIPTHKNLKIIHFLFQLLIITIELMPVLMKVFMDTAMYDLLLEEKFHKIFERINKESKR